MAIRFWNYPCIQTSLQKAGDSEDCKDESWGNAPRCYTDEAGCVVCKAFHSRTWIMITPTTIKNFIVKCDFWIERVRSNDSVVKLSEDEENDWHSLQPLGMQFEDYTTCDSGFEVCGILSVDQVLEQQVTGPEEDG
jgi:hypothetical protein